LLTAVSLTESVIHVERSKGRNRDPNRDLDRLTCHSMKIAMKTCPPQADYDKDTRQLLIVTECRWFSDESYVTLRAIMVSDR